MLWAKRRHELLSDGGVAHFFFCSVFSLVGPPSIGPWNVGMDLYTCQKRCLPSKVALPVLCKRSSMGVNGLADCYSRIFIINQAVRIKALGRRFLCQLRARTPEECIDLSIQHSTACILCHVALYLETNLHSDFSAFLSDGQLYEHSLLVLVSSMSINCDVSFLLCRFIFKSSIKQCRLSPSI